MPRVPRQTDIPVIRARARVTYLILRAATRGTDAVQTSSATTLATRVATPMPIGPALAGKAPKENVERCPCCGHILRTRGLRPDLVEITNEWLKTNAAEGARQQ